MPCLKVFSKLSQLFRAKVIKIDNQVHLSQAFEYSSISKYTGKSVSETDVMNSVSHDLSSVKPFLPKTYNLAAYVNDSEILKNLLYLNVNLSNLEKKPKVAEKILKLNFNDIKHHILFLRDNIGSDNVGNFITKNPMILNEPLEDLKIRLFYLESKRFSKEQIQQIILKNAFWLNFR